MNKKVIKVEFFFSFLPRKIGHSRKIMVLKKFGHFEICIMPDNYVHLINVEKKSFMPKCFGHSGNILTLIFFE